MGGGHEKLVWNGGGVVKLWTQKWRGGPSCGRRPPDLGYPPLGMFLEPSLTKDFEQIFIKETRDLLQ